jgi:hypothetical protein
MVDGEYIRAVWVMMVLLLEGSFRSDRSSTLPKENNRFDYFSVSGV